MLLRAENVCKAYPSPSGSRLEVLRGVSFELDAGQSLAVVGPSGSGKSSILNIAGGLDRADSGRVWIDGRDIAALPDGELCLLRNRVVGFVFQLHHLLPQLSAIENVLIPTLAAGWDGSHAAAAMRAQSLLGRVGLGDRRTHRPAQLSGGECQRVALVRALINTPRLLLADEPTGSLDAAAAVAMGDILLDLNREENVALLVVTHSEALASRMARQARLANGVLELNS